MSMESQGLRLVALDVHGEEVDLRDAALLEEIVQGDGGHRDLPDHGLRVRVEVRQEIYDPLPRGRGDAFGAFGQVEGLLRSRLIAHEVVEKAGVGAVLRVAGGVLGVGVDADARPAEMLLEVEGRAVLLPVVTADVHEEAVLPVVEEMADDELFVELGVELLAGGEQIVVRLRRRATGEPPQHETGDDPEGTMLAPTQHLPDSSKTALR
jgi:hypothetical protein